MSFEFDTSGWVTLPDGQTCTFHLGLSPFVQGYVEALFAGMAADPDWAVAGKPFAWAFYHLDPSALALILRDCASFENIATGLGVKKLGATEGRYFWVGRNNGTLQHAWSAAFPPLQPYLSDEGRVCLREAPR